MIAILKNITYLFFPLPLALELFFTGIMIFIFSQKKRLGKFCLIASFVILIIFSNRAVAQWLLGILEDRYPALVITSEFIEKHDIEYIVVLGGLLNYSN